MLPPRNYCPAARAGQDRDAKVLTTKKNKKTEQTSAILAQKASRKGAQSRGSKAGINFEIDRDGAEEDERTRVKRDGKGRARNEQLTEGST